MADFFSATAPNPATGVPDAHAVEDYLQRHPESATALSLAAANPPDSFASLTYHAVHAFGLVAEDRFQWVRLVIEPKHAPPACRLGKEVALELPKNYLQLELKSRLPVSYTVRAQLPQHKDPLHDPTQLWSEDGEQIELGTLVIEEAIADGGRVVGFDPLNIDTFIAPADELVADRHNLYLTAQSRRTMS